MNLRVFGVDAAFDRMAAEVHVALAHGEFLARRDTDLLLDQIDAGDHFSDRVLDLDTGVHLDEIELAVFIQKLESTRATILHAAACFRATLADALDETPGNAGSGGFFDDLLVTALHGTVALAQPEGVAAPVGENLHLDMARIL